MKIEFHFEIGVSHNVKMEFHFEIGTSHYVEMKFHFEIDVSYYVKIEFQLEIDTSHYVKVKFQNEIGTLHYAEVLFQIEMRISSVRKRLLEARHGFFSGGLWENCPQRGDSGDGKWLGELRSVPADGRKCQLAPKRSYVPTLTPKQHKRTGRRLIFCRSALDVI